MPETALATLPSLRLGASAMATIDWTVDVLDQIETHWWGAGLRPRLDG